MAKLPEYISKRDHERDIKLLRKEIFSAIKEVEKKITQKDGKKPKAKARKLRVIGS